MTQHASVCRCVSCRHGRFCPGPASRSRRKRRALNFRGVFQYRAKLPKAARRTTVGPVLSGCPQVLGPITYGPRDFLAAMRSKNKFLGGNAQPTVRWVV